MAVSDSDLVDILRRDLAGCVGYADDDVRKARVDSLNYYLQRKKGDEVTGRSHAVAGTLSASVDANCAQMIDAITTGNIAEYDPTGPDDETQAQLETDVAIHFVMKKENGFMELAAAIKDALLLRVAVMKVWVEEREIPDVKTYEDVAPEAVDHVANGADVLAYDPTGEVLRTRALKTVLRFQCKSVAPENFFYQATQEDFNTQEGGFWAERHIDTRSKLIQMGHNKRAVQALTAFAPSRATNPDAAARDPSGITYPEAVNLDTSQDLIEWFECYKYLDSDGDGIAERHRYVFVPKDQTVLSDEFVTLVPYAIGVTMLMPHRVTGISQFDKLRQNQDEHTGLKRALYDNVNAVTKNRLGVLNGAVNQDDLDDGRPNGTVRVKNVEDVRQAILPLSVPDNSANILANMEALKRERSELGGASLDLATGQMQIGGDRMGSQGLDRAYSVMEQLASYMTKTIANTLIRNVFLLTHATLREHYTQPVHIKRKGKWVTTAPASWPAREGVTIKLGMNPGERARRVQALDKVIDSQIMLAQNNMDEVLVNMDGFYKVLMDRDRLSDVQNPEQYYVDPGSDESLKALKTKTEAAERETQQRQALMTQAVGLEQMRTGLDKYIADAKLQFEYWNAVLKSEIEEARLVAPAATAALNAAREQPNGADADTQSGSEGASGGASPE